MRVKSVDKLSKTLTECTACEVCRREENSLKNNI